MGEAQEAKRRVAQHDGEPATSFARNIEYYLLTSLALDFSSVDTEADRHLQFESSERYSVVESKSLQEPGDTSPTQQTLSLDLQAIPARL